MKDKKQKVRYISIYIRVQAEAAHVYVVDVGMDPCAVREAIPDDHRGP